MPEQERIAELEGRLAQARGNPSMSNPNRVGSRAWRAWDNGWRDESWSRIPKLSAPTGVESEYTWEEVERTKSW